MKKSANVLRKQHEDSTGFFLPIINLHYQPSYVLKLPLITRKMWGNTYLQALTNQRMWNHEYLSILALNQECLSTTAHLGQLQTQ